MSIYHPKYRPDIDGLRAVAVLGVVGFHLFPIWLKGGFVGVDIFFVISGYLISTIIFKSRQNSKFSFSEFYIRRIKRIFPALIVVLLFCLIMGWFTLLVDEYRQLGMHVAAGVAFLSNIILWQESGYFDKASITKPLLHLWSLGVEEQFYIIWPLLVLIAWKRSTLLTLIVVAIIASFLLNVMLIEHYAIATFYLPFTRLWELLLGSVLAYLGMHAPHLFEYKKTIYSDIQSFLGLSLIVASMLLLTKDASFPGWVALYPTVGTCLVIAAGKDAFANKWILALKPAIWIGLISYPLYLWHWPLLSFATILETEFPIREIRMAIVPISLFLAWLTYFFVEKPVRFGYRNDKKCVAFLCVSLGSIGLLGLTILYSPNLKVRFDVSKSQLEAFKWKEEWDFTEGCRKKFSFATTCMQTDSSLEPDAILIGDSHANQFFIGLDQYLSSIGKSLLHIGAPSCIPFYDLESSTRGVEDYCVEKMGKALDYAVSTPSVKTVFLASRGPAYLTGRGFGDVDYSDRVLKLRSHPEVVSQPKKYEIAMIETIERLLAAKKQVVFIVDNPELGFYPVSCVVPRNFFRKQREVCGVKKEEFDIRNKQYHEIVSSVLKDFPSVIAFYPHNYLCDNEYCVAIKSNTILYRDDDHLSYDGSMFIGQQFAHEAKRLGVNF